MSDSSAGVSSFDAGELAEVLDLRRGVVLRTVAAATVIAVLLTLLAPGLLPPTPLVGALAGLVVGLAAAGVAWAVDAGDELIRGPRHVRAVDGAVTDRLPADAGEERLAGLARGLAAHDASGPLRIAVTSAGGSRGSGEGGRLSDRLARAVARLPRRVMYLDTTGTAPAGESIPDVADGDVDPRDVVEFDDELMLARLRGGADRMRTLRSLSDLIRQLPSDIEVALIALPPLMEPGALDALAICDRALITVEEGTSRRVDLMAALDAVDTTGTPAETVVLTPAAGAAARPAGSAPDDRPDEWSEDATDPRDNREWTGRVTRSAAPPAEPAGPEPAPRGVVEPGTSPPDPAAGAPVPDDAAEPGPGPEPRGAPAGPPGRADGSPPADEPADGARGGLDDLSGADLPGAGDAEPEDAAPEPDAPGTGPTGPEQAGPEQTEPEQTGPEQTGPEQTGTDREPLVPDDGTDPGTTGDPEAGSQLRRILPATEDPEAGAGVRDEPPAPWERAERRSPPQTPSEPPEPASEPPSDGDVRPATPSGPPAEPEGVPPAEPGTGDDVEESVRVLGEDDDGTGAADAPRDAADPPRDRAGGPRGEPGDPPADPATGGTGDAPGQRKPAAGDPGPQSERHAALRRTAALNALSDRRDEDEHEDGGGEDDRDQRGS